MPALENLLESMKMGSNKKAKRNSSASRRPLTPEERIAKRRREMPSKYRKLYDRVMSGEASPRDAIKMNCLMCWGYNKSETATCDNVTCPLYLYRPYQNAVKSPSERVESSNIDEKSEEVVS